MKFQYSASKIQLCTGLQEESRRSNILGKWLSLHSSEISGLCSSKCSIEILQNLLYFICFFSSFLHYVKLYFFYYECPGLSMLTVDIDQRGNIFFLRKSTFIRLQQSIKCKFKMNNILKNGEWFLKTFMNDDCTIFLILSYCARRG